MMHQREGGIGLERSGSGGGRRPPTGAAPRRAIDEARLRQQAIGVKLRQLFDEIVNEPVPQEFLEILRRGDATSTSGDEN